MKTLIFIIAMLLIIAVLFWVIRKPGAEAKLAQRQSIKRRKKQEKRVLTPQKHAKWPVIIRTVPGQNSVQEGSKINEPAMTTIEFAPSEHLTVQEVSSKKADVR